MDGRREREERREEGKGEEGRERWKKITKKGRKKLKFGIAGVSVVSRIVLGIQDRK